MFNHLPASSSSLVRESRALIRCVTSIRFFGCSLICKELWDTYLSTIVFLKEPQGLEYLRLIIIKYHRIIQRYNIYIFLEIARQKVSKKQANPIYHILLFTPFNIVKFWNSGMYTIFVKSTPNLDFNSFKSLNYKS